LGSVLLTLIRDSSFDIVLSEQLVVLCESICRSDLASLRQAIQTVCTEATDVMVLGGSIVYPGEILVVEGFSL
jgi:hypothetical protein